MRNERLSFRSAVGSDAGFIVDRVSQPLDKAVLPQQLSLVSADNHIELTEDIFYREFPSRLREAAPRVWFDKYWHVGFKGDFEALPVGFDMDAALSKTVMNDGFDFTIRGQHLVTLASLNPKNSVENYLWSVGIKNSIAYRYSL